VALFLILILLSSFNKSLFQQGKRTDLHEVADLVLTRVPLRQIALEHPTTFIRYHRGLSALQNATLPSRGRNEHTRCFVFLGPGGRGKTNLAMSLAQAFSSILNVGVFSLPAAKSSGTYWTNYNYGDVVVIEEMDGTRFKPTFFNKLIDQGEMYVPGYGCEIPFNSKVVIITTNFHPMKWWQLPPIAIKPLMRRIYLRYIPNLAPVVAPRLASVGVSNSRQLVVAAPLRSLQPNDYGHPQ